MPHLERRYPDRIRHRGLRGLAVPLRSAMVAGGSLGGVPVALRGHASVAVAGAVPRRAVARRARPRRPTSLWRRQLHRDSRFPDRRASGSAAAARLRLSAHGRLVPAGRTAVEDRFVSQCAATLETALVGRAVGNWRWPGADARLERQIIQRMAVVGPDRDFRRPPLERSCWPWAMPASWWPSQA